MNLLRRVSTFSRAVTGQMFIGEDGQLGRQPVLARDQPCDRRVSPDDFEAAIQGEGLRGGRANQIGATLNLTRQHLCGRRSERLGLVRICGCVRREAEAEESADMVALHAYRTGVIDLGVQDGLLPESAGKLAGAPVHKPLCQAFV
jgi:hypothetical protein